MHVPPIFDLVAGARRGTPLPRNDGVALGRERWDDAHLHVAPPRRGGDHLGQGHVTLRADDLDVDPGFRRAGSRDDLSARHRPLPTRADCRGHRDDAKSPRHDQQFCAEVRGPRPLQVLRQPLFEATADDCVEVARPRRASIFPCPALRCDGVYPVRIEVSDRWRHVDEVVAARRQIDGGRATTARRPG